MLSVVKLIKLPGQQNHIYDAVTQLSGNPAQTETGFSTFAMTKWCGYCAANICDVVSVHGLCRIKNNK